MNKSCHQTLQHQPIVPEIILETEAFSEIKIFEGEIGSSKNRSQDQIESALSQLKVFLSDKQGHNVLVFSDGSAMGQSIGHGGCGVVLVPPGEAGVRVTSMFVSRYTENVECEVEGIILALEQALKYYLESGKRSDRCYVFTDCESAIDIFVNQNNVLKWSEALRRSWSLKRQLDELDVSVSLAWVPGHCGVEFNEVADIAAKNGCSQIESQQKTDELSYSTISKWIDFIEKEEWQDKWSRSDTGVFTKEIIPLVKNKIKIPSNRNIGISLIRCLLNNAAVADNMFRMKLAEDPDCECGKSRQTVEHVLLHCDNFKSERLLVKKKVSNIWERTKRSGNLQMDLNTLLNPSMSKLDASGAREVSEIFENFLSQIDLTF